MLSFWFLASRLELVWVWVLGAVLDKATFALRPKLGDKSPFLRAFGFPYFVALISLTAAFRESLFTGGFHELGISRLRPNYIDSPA